MAGIPKVTISFDADLDKLKKGTADAQKEVQTFGDKITDFGIKASKAFALAAVAAGAYAIKLGIDGVKAAVADEAAQVKLATALKNVTGATDQQISANEKFIKTLSLQTAIADDQLRPAMQRLVNATHDVGSAQNLLDLATRVSVNSGKELETVTNALAKAHEGNTTALGKLGLGISAAELKGLSYTDMIAKLNAIYPDLGANADTVAFKFKLFQNAVNEAKETVGAALLPTLQKLMSFVSTVAVPAMNAFVAGLTGDTGASKGLNKTEKSAYDLGVTIRDMGKSFADVFAVFDGKGQSSMNGLLNIMKALATTANVIVTIIKELIGFIIEMANQVIRFLNLFGAGIEKIPQISGSAFDKMNAQTASILGSSVISGAQAQRLNTPVTTGGGGGGGGAGGLSALGGGGGAAGGFSTSAAKSMTDLVDKLQTVSSTIGEISFLYESGAISKSSASAQLAAQQKQFDILTRQANALAAAQEITTGGMGAMATDQAAANSISVTNNFGIVGSPEAAASVVVDTLNESLARGGIATSLAARLAAAS